MDIIEGTKYPWDGAVKILVSPLQAGKFSILMCIPGWPQNHAKPEDL
ncbi:MAG: hypothetical protein ACUVV5_08640 [Candidatus Aminicenantales bacterium]